MRIFLSLVLVALALNKIEANPKEWTTLVSPDDITYLNDEINENSADSISAGIPNRELHHTFFESLWEIFKAFCQTVENAQFLISPMHADSLAVRFNDILEIMDDVYEGHANLQIMKMNMATLRDTLQHYAEEMAPLKFELFFDGTTFFEWINRHADDFQKLKSDKNLVKYLKEIKRLVEAIEISIKRHQREIDNRQLDRLNEKISTSVRNYDVDAENSADLSDSLLEIDRAIIGLMNAGKVWSNLKTHVGHILHDLNQLKLLMEKQWTDMDYIFRTQTFPQQLPKFQLAN